eukprot:TRINITY_DN986_c0_g4_i1.p2 TRINITY_DN986_c0_g4~~TRINITY_DN986_c0_g4_i1.p2  ORF type:complete len:161 (-),score=55.99 TRINITY_DN986_c0_g4_i1:99-581(-)
MEPFWYFFIFYSPAPANLTDQQHAAGVYLGQTIDRLSADHPLKRIPIQGNTEADGVAEEEEEEKEEKEKEEKEGEETNEMNGKEQTTEEGKEKSEGDDLMNVEGEARANIKETKRIAAKEADKGEVARDRYLELYEIFGGSLSPYLFSSASASASHNLFI